jgi:hypothetical protein
MRPLVIALALGSSACSPVDAGPEPVIPLGALPRPSPAPEGLSELVDATIAVNELALRRPELGDLVDAELDAMSAYVQRHGRGFRGLPPPQEAAREGSGPHVPEPEMAHRRRLSRGAVTLLGYLPFETHSDVLARVGVAALARQLDDDARLQNEDPLATATTGDIAAELREGLARIAIPRFDDTVKDQVASAFLQWNALPARPRALVLDLSTCDSGGPRAPAALVNALAPGLPAFRVSHRDGATQQVVHTTWQGAAGWGRAALDEAPVFVITSERTAGLAEAVAHALRRHRSATIVGRATAGSGVVNHRIRLPWGTWFEFTLAELHGADGQPLRGRPVVPDACVTREGIAALPDPTLEAYGDLCGNAPEQLDREEIVEYVKRLLDAQAAAGESADVGDQTEAPVRGR